MKTQTITWTTAKHAFAVTVELVTERVEYCDGANVAVPCCDLRLAATVAGYGIAGTGRPNRNALNLPVGCVASIGKVAMSADVTAQVEAAIAAVEATPEWQAKIATIKASDAEASAYDAHAAMMRRAMRGN